jgi:hypothetical protein
MSVFGTTATGVPSVCSGGPRVLHRRWDFYATRDVEPGDTVIFAEGDETQPVAERNATDLDERWLSPEVAAQTGAAFAAG